MKDVTGFLLGEAIQLLKEEGITDIKVKLAAAPRKADEEWNLQSRVVRQKEVGSETWELVVCNLDLKD